MTAIASNRQLWRFWKAYLALLRGRAAIAAASGKRDSAEACCLRRRGGLAYEANHLRQMPQVHWVMMQALGKGVWVQRARLKGCSDGARSFSALHCSQHLHPHGAVVLAIPAAACG